MQLIALGAALFTGASCAPSPTQGGFDSPNPAAKIYAIEQAARTGDISATASIVEQLDSDDPAVRLVAITALKRLTDRTMGFRHYDTPVQRRKAIKRWVDALNAEQTEGQSISARDGAAQND